MACPPHLTLTLVAVLWEQWGEGHARTRWGATGPPACSPAPLRKHRALKTQRLVQPRAVILHRLRVGTRPVLSQRHRPFAPAALRAAVSGLTCRPLCALTCRYRGCGSFPAPPQPHTPGQPGASGSVGSRALEASCAVCHTHSPRPPSPRVGRRRAGPSSGQRGQLHTHRATLRQGLPVQPRVLCAWGVGAPWDGSEP